jgi:hypothetical protein
MNDGGILFSEEMIPVRIYCDEKSIDKIIALTMEHYQQEGNVLDNETLK